MSIPSISTNLFCSTDFYRRESEIDELKKRIEKHLRNDSYWNTLETGQKIDLMENVNEFERMVKEFKMRKFYDLNADQLRDSRRFIATMAKVMKEIDLFFDKTSPSISRSSPPLHQSKYEHHLAVRPLMPEPKMTVATSTENAETMLHVRPAESSMETPESQVDASVSCITASTSLSTQHLEKETPISDKGILVNRASTRWQHWTFKIDDLSLEELQASYRTLWETFNNDMLLKTKSLAERVELVAEFHRLVIAMQSKGLFSLPASCFSGSPFSKDTQRRHEELYQQISQTISNTKVPEVDLLIEQIRLSIYLRSNSSAMTSKTLGFYPLQTPTSPIFYRTTELCEQVDRTGFTIYHLTFWNGHHDLDSRLALLGEYQNASIHLQTRHCMNATELDRLEAQEMTRRSKMHVGNAQSSQLWGTSVESSSSSSTSISEKSKENAPQKTSLASRTFSLAKLYFERRKLQNEIAQLQKNGYILKITGFTSTEIYVRRDQRKAVQLVIDHHRYTDVWEWSHHKYLPFSEEACICLRKFFALQKKLEEFDAQVDSIKQSTQRSYARYKESQKYKLPSRSPIPTLPSFVPYANDVNAVSSKINPYVAIGIAVLNGAYDIYKIFNPEVDDSIKIPRKLIDSKLRFL